MEVNHYDGTILGAVANEDIVEGRLVCLTSHTFNYDFGSKTDLPACKRPTGTAEAARSRYCIAFAEDNRSTPIYDTNPSYSYALRYGFDQTTNVPFSASVYLTHPGNMSIPQTIPSGALVKLYGEGIYTVPSGHYLYEAAMEVPGTQLTVANVGAGDAAADAGKPKVGATNVVAEVIRYNTTNSDLTFKILH